MSVRHGRHPISKHGAAIATHTVDGRHGRGIYFSKWQNFPEMPVAFAGRSEYNARVNKGDRYRILIGGLFHESHTFLEGSLGLEDFSVSRDTELLASAGDSSPMAGAVEEADRCGWTLVPTVDFRAMPGPLPGDEVFEAFWSEFSKRAAPALASGVDAIFMVLHGAMATPSYPDVEGELLDRIRQLPGGEQVPIGGVLDLHANVGEGMMRSTNSLVAYRENPHTDAKESACRAVRILHEQLLRQRPARSHWAPARVLWPPTGVGTDDNPMKHLESVARRLEADNPEFLAVNVFAGFSFADVPDAGVSFSVVTTGSCESSAHALRGLVKDAVEQRKAGDQRGEPLDAVMSRLQTEVHSSGPVLIVEPADNIGGGAPGDGTPVLRAFLEHQTTGAGIILNDPEAVKRLADLPIGGLRTVPIGGRGSRLDPGPVPVNVQLVSRSDGRFDLADPKSHLASMYGQHIDMGPCAVVSHRGITILLTSRKTPPFDLGQWLSQGIDPRTLSVINVKAAVAHRRAYDPIAAGSHTVDTPGPCSSNLTRLPFQRVRRPIYPLTEAFDTDGAAVL